MTELEAASKEEKDSVVLPGLGIPIAEHGNAQCLSITYLEMLALNLRAHFLQILLRTHRDFSEGIDQKNPPKNPNPP